jgi:hypothetical protein
MKNPGIYCRTEELYDKVREKAGFTNSDWETYGVETITSECGVFGPITTHEKNIATWKEYTDGTWISAEQYLNIPLVNTKFKTGDIVYHSSNQCTIRVIGDGILEDTFAGVILSSESGVQEVVGSIHSGFYDNFCSLIDETIEFKAGDLVCLKDAPYKNIGIVLAPDIAGKILVLWPNERYRGHFDSNKLMKMDDMKLSLKIKTE